MDSLPFISFAQTLVNPALKECFWSAKFSAQDEYALRWRHPFFGAASSFDKVAGSTFRQNVTL